MSKITREERITRKKRLKALKHTRKAHVRNSARIVKYGIKGIARNAWLTIAAIFVMTIALIIVSTTFVSRFILDDTVSEIKRNIDISLYLKTDTPYEVVKRIEGELLSLKSIEHLRTTSPDEAAEENIKRLRDKGLDESVIAELREVENLYPWIINVYMQNLSERAELNEYLGSNPDIIAALDETYSSENYEERLEAINKITGTTEFVERIGIILGVVFAVVAALIIFNTIRMAIFNRREEIYMMKLVGASKSFIRGPFLIEAMMYGIISAGITVIMVSGALFLLEEPLGRYGVVVGPTLNLLHAYLYLAVAGVMFIGGMIGVCSALLAARKYLKDR